MGMGKPRKPARCSHFGEETVPEGSEIRPKSTKNTDPSHHHQPPPNRLGWTPEWLFRGWERAGGAGKPREPVNTWFFGEETVSERSETRPKSTKNAGPSRHHQHPPSGPGWAPERLVRGWERVAGSGKPGKRDKHWLCGAYPFETLVRNAAGNRTSARRGSTKNFGKQRISPGGYRVFLEKSNSKGFWRFSSV